MNNPELEHLVQKLEDQAKDIRDIKLAVIGDDDLGLKGLVGDMRDMKNFRSSITVKVAWVSGAVASVVLLGKALVTKLLDLK